MSGLTFQEMNEWRVEAEIILGEHNIKTINPVLFYNFEMEPNFTDKECMLFDLTAVRNSNVILVNLHKNSVGTAIELFDANGKQIPVIGFNASKDLHPWMRECCYKICDDLYSAVNYIVDYYASFM